jgi:hypothetical protein
MERSALSCSTSMADRQILCVVKTGTTHQTITHLGGAGWCWPKEKVIDAIWYGKDTFFTLANGRRAEVRVVDGNRGPYLQSFADGVPTNDLLSLPACRRP